MRLQIIKYTMPFKLTRLGQALKYALNYVLFHEPTSSYSNIASLGLSSFWRGRFGAPCFFVPDGSTIWLSLNLQHLYFDQWITCSVKVACLMFTAVWLFLCKTRQNLLESLCVNYLCLLELNELHGYFRLICAPHKVPFNILVINV